MTSEFLNAFGYCPTLHAVEKLSLFIWYEKVRAKFVSKSVDIF